MLRKRKLTKLAVMGTAVISAAFVLAACGSSTTPPASSSTSTTTKTMVEIPGGTMTIAEAAAGGPNYIFPMMGGAYFSVANFQLIYLLFRPLYFPGVGNTPALNPGLSVAQFPVYSNGGKTVTVQMKGYKWSNGESVDAQDVVFWMNLLKADATSWAAYAPGPTQFPGDVSNVVADNATDTVTFTLDGAYNQLWFTNNELSQITPLPLAWDITSAGAAAGSGGCSKATFPSITTAISSKGVFSDTSASAKACAAVYAFLTSKTEAGDLGTYATNPLWQIVDGPFHLTAYDATDNGATVVPNPAYSGPVKAKIDKLVMEPFTTDTAEFNVLATGKQINIGYVPPQNLPVFKGKITFSMDGPNSGLNNAQLAANYTLAPVYGWGVNYFAMNYTNPTSGPIFSQLYIRQAFQSLMNQTLWIQLYQSGYGAPTYGPVPVLPPTVDATPQESSNPYPYSPSHAIALLTSHHWKVVPNGTTTCSLGGASGCGAGIKTGAALSFQYLYYNGAVSFNSQIKELASSWAQAGIKLQLEGKAFGDVISTAATPCTAGKACPWDIANWGGGWIYAPDYYPTGEEIFATGAASNFGLYSDKQNDANILATNKPGAIQTLYTYENYLATQVPDIWQPEAPGALTEIGKNVCGVLPQNVLLNWVAEDWYFCKAG
ncbi:MAG TPA: ABC transporter substrate-binding protein [Acidimicrobiales bacterium]|nr:ABC transporter substrate-binding protein [Acidimicrobiales bacterium]